MTHRSVLVLASITALLAGCAPAPSRSVPLKTTASPVREAPPVEVPAAAAEVFPANVTSELPRPVQPVDNVAVVIRQTRERFERGSDLYDAGFLKQARTEFDAAVDLLLTSSKTYPNDGRIQKELNDLVARIHEMELEAIRHGDGFTDQAEDHAAIDDLNQVPTFPAPIDPRQKEAVEAEVRNGLHDLPIDINGRVLTALDYFQNGRGRNTMSVGLERVGLYRPMMERILKEEGVPLDLVFLAQAESAFLPRAISKAKARGIWQFISSRGKEYGLRQTWWIDERSDPEKSTRAAARHLSDLYAQFNDWNLAMAAYNAGPVRVSQAMKKTGATTFWELADKKALPKETLNYVPTVLAMAIIGRNPDQYGFNVEPAQAQDVERVSLDKATDLRVIAETIGVPVDLLKDLNPHVLRWTTPPDDKEFELVLPTGHSEAFEKVAALPENERILWRYHNIRKGETLSVIAKNYGVSVNDLTQANKISTKSILRIGQELLIPMSGSPRATAATTSQVSQTASKTSKPPSSYTVRRGDTLSGIAAKYNLTVNELKKWNKLTSTRLNIGQKLSLVAPSVRQAN